jgi:hypothetical protein
MSFEAMGKLKNPFPFGDQGLVVNLDDRGSRMSGDDQRVSSIRHRGELGLPALELVHQTFVVGRDLLDVQVAVGVIAARFGILLLVEPSELDVSRGHVVVEGVQVGHSLVGQDQQLVVSLLQDGHSLAVDLQLFAVEADLGFAAFLHVALELKSNRVQINTNWLSLKLIHKPSVDSRLLAWQLILSELSMKQNPKSRFFQNWNNLEGFQKHFSLVFQIIHKNIHTLNSI